MCTNTHFITVPVFSLSCRELKHAYTYCHCVGWAIEVAEHRKWSSDFHRQKTVQPSVLRAGASRVTTYKRIWNYFIQRLKKPLSYNILTTYLHISTLLLITSEVLQTEGKNQPQTKRYNVNWKKAKKGKKRASFKKISIKQPSVGPGFCNRLRPLNE